MNRTTLPAATAICALLVPLGANAQTFTDAGAFAAAVTSPTKADFNALGDGFYGGPGFGGTGTLTSAGITISTATSYLFSQAADRYGTGTFLSVQQFSPTVIDFSFAMPRTAFGLAYDSATPLNLVIDGQSFVVPASPFPALSFFGVILPGTFTSATLTTSGSGVDLDNITFATAAAVPESATWAMMIGGLGLAGATLRRRRMPVRFVR
jgi:hypothetical protein